MTHRDLRRTPLRLALALRAWVVVLLAFPAFGFAASPSAGALRTAEIGLETAVRAAPPLPASESRPVDGTVAAETEEEEDAEGRDGPKVRGLCTPDRTAFVDDAVAHSTAVELVVPNTPLRLHRLHNRGPPIG